MPVKKPALGRPIGPKKVSLTVLVLDGTKKTIRAKATREGKSAGQVLDAAFTPKPKKH